VARFWESEAKSTGEIAYATESTAGARPGVPSCGGQALLRRASLCHKFKGDQLKLAATKADAESKERTQAGLPSCEGEWGTQKFSGRLLR
jgi:hypothetical protein